MKIVAVSDLHLTLKENYGYTTKSGINSRVFDKLNALKEAVDYAIANKADLFVDCGDTFDLLNPPEILRFKFIETISPLIMNKIKTIIIMGNHVYNSMYYNLQSEEKLLDALKIETFQIINKPITMDFKGENLSFIPWAPLDQVRQFLRDHPKRIVFHHLPIENAILNDYEVKSKEGLTKEDLEIQLAFIGGHYHKHQVEYNWCYVGSLVKQDFSERNQEKGFLDIELNHSMGILNINFIPVKDRKFIQLEFSEPQEPIEYIESLNEIDGAVIKTKFTGTKRWLYHINKSEYFSILKSKGASRILQPELIATDDETEKASSYKLDSDFSSNIEDYCKEKNRENEIPLMNEILIEVINSRKII